MNLRKLLMVVFLAVSVCVMSAGVGAAAVITVDDSGGADFMSIQAAVDAASEGDTIEVRSGTYVENVDVGNRLTLIGDGADVVTVQAANSNDHVFDVTANCVNISGFKAYGATASGKAGIYVGDGIAHSNISNNAASNNYYGIYLDRSNNNILTENTPSKNYMHGIRLAYSNNNTILNNTVSSDNGCAILLYASADNRLINNDFSNSFQGIFMYASSNDNLVSGNTASGNWQGGIYLEGNNNTITGNTASNNGDFGILLESSGNNILYHNNLIDNARNTYDPGTNQWDSASEGNYYSDYTGTDSDGDGIGDTPYPIPGGSSMDNYPLMNPWVSTPISGPVHNINKGTDYTTIQAAIDDASLGDEIHVDSGTYDETVIINKQVTLEGAGPDDVIVANYLHGGDEPIFYVFSDLVNISGFTVKNSDSSGIFLSNVNQCKISDNKILDNIIGVAIKSSNNNMLTNNIFKNNGLVIEDSYGNIVKNNTINNKTLIYLENVSNFTIQNAGQVVLNKCTNITIKNQNFSNVSVGIELWETNNSNIFNNTVMNNIFGIFIGKSNKNTVFHNNLIENLQNTHDTGINDWDNSAEGNYYSDYTGIDSNDDGIGDTPYSIPGGSSVDRYPLMHPWTDSSLSGKIAFASSHDGKQEVYVMNADGSGDPINLTNRPDANDGDPTWSPDGTQIAFSSNRSGNWTTYIMNADGSDQVCLLEGVYDAWGPAWSPDGTKIAVAVKINTSGDFEIYTVDVQSKVLTPVTDNISTDSHPSWSPDSHKIAFTSNRNNNPEIYIADLLTGIKTRLTYNSSNDDYPEWSPDGSMIAFVSERDGNPEIYSMDIASKAITRLTYDDSTDKHAQWSPDGQNIIFVSNRSGDMDVYVMKADGTSTTCLVDWEGDETHPTWSPDHSSPPAYYVGEGAPDTATKNHFIDAYNRNGGVNILGSPTTEVHRAWCYMVQDFPGASGYAGGIIMYNPYKNYAYYIHSAIWERYYGLGGPRTETDIEFELGPPTSNILPYIHTQPPEISSHGTLFRYQNFEGGALNHNIDTGEVFEIHGAIFAKWKELGYAAHDLGLVTSDEREAALSPIGTEGRVSDFEGGHIHWHRTGGHGGVSYETHGAIDAVYCAEGGSGGDLGFPVSDEYVNPSGYPQSDFEGGYITTTDWVNYYMYMNDDTEGPVLEITSPADGFHTDEYRIKISGTASDDSGILNNEVWIMVVSDGLDYCPIYAAPYNPDPTKQTWNDIDVPLGYGNNEIVVWTWDNKHNRVEKTISVYCNPPDFRLVHLTDVHIGCDPTSLIDPKKAGEEVDESTSRFTKTLDAIGNLDPKPVILLITGDLVEWNDESFLSAFKTILDSHIHQEKMEEHNISVYCTPGNHDRREFNPLDPLDPLDDHLVNYHKYITPPGPNIGEDDYLIKPDNFTFEYGGYLFIGLDSGNDYSQQEPPPFTPEGSGLKTDQMDKLKEMNQNIPKIIFMHHPAINEGDDTSGNPLALNNCTEYGGNDECIAFNRCEFIKYCTDYNVQLVLTGHTHKPYYTQVSNTCFIQTPSATKDKKGKWGIVPLDVLISNPGYQIIDIKSGKAYPRLYTITGVHPNIKGLLKCPAHLHAYDSQGRHTGLNASGGIETNIPDSFYIIRYNNSNPNETEMILLYNTTEEYRFEIVANLTEEEKASQEIESFNFTVEQQTDDTRTTIAHLSIPLTENTTAILPINLTTTAYTMEIDYDGNSLTDETIDPDFTETNYAPIASIIAPEIGSIFNTSKPVEFNGTGRDPEDGILTNFSLVWYSDINGVIGAGERFSTVNLSRGAHRITLMVNDSVDLVDTDSITITVVDTTPPSSITNLTPTAGTTHLNFNWTNPPDPDFNHTELYLNSTFLTNIPVPQNYYNITGLLPNTSYELSTHTADTSGNINKTWVNNTARTLLIPDTTPPIITITSPINNTLYTTGSVDLNYTVNEPTDWEGYSLGGIEYNITLSGNTTLSGLNDGSHILLRVYANDTAGNMNSSTLWFTIDTTPPSNIFDIGHTTGETWLNWTWTNPPDPDFNHTEIYLNGTFQANTPAEFFNATDLVPDTMYTIGTRTVDINGNINLKWVNDTAMTIGLYNVTILQPIDIHTEDYDLNVGRRMR